MKKQSLRALVVGFLAVGLLVTVSQAALVEYVVKLGPGENGEVTASDGNVLLYIFAHIQNNDENVTNDGFNQGYFKLVSSGPLTGDLGSQAILYSAPPSNVGTVQDLNGGFGDDIGGLDSNLLTGTTGNWINPHLATSTYAYASDANGVLIATAIWHLTGTSGSTFVSAIAADKNTGTSSAQTIHKGVSDGVVYGLMGDAVGQGEGVTITFIPEPMTLVLLAGGGLGLLRLHRRRRA